jgi:hypothetical protein
VIGVSYYGPAPARTGARPTCSSSPRTGEQLERPRYLAHRERRMREREPTPEISTATAIGLSVADGVSCRAGRIAVTRSEDLHRQITVKLNAAGAMVAAVTALTGRHRPDLPASGRAGRYWTAPHPFSMSREYRMRPGRRGTARCWPYGP